MALNLHLLRIFMYVAEQKSFSRAAKVLYISQPAVSKSVQELEQQISIALINRSRQELSLTEAGNILYRYARRLFAVEQEAIAALEQLQNLEGGHLAVGGSQTIGTYMLPSLLGLFHRLHPGIRLSLEIQNTQSIVESLRSKPLDLVFVEGPVTDPDLIVTPWRIDRLVVIATPQHPFVSQQPVSLEQLTSQPYIQREAGSGTREIVESAIRKHGASLNVAMELGSNQAVKQAVAAGLGISIVPEATISLELATGLLASIEVQDFSLQRSLAQVTIKGKYASHATTAFQQLVRME